MAPESLPVEPPPPPPPPAQRVPFWGYGDVLVFAGMMLPCMIFSFVVLPWAARLKPEQHTWQLILEQLVFYALLIAILAAIFRLQYGRPLWHSLGWVSFRLAPAWPLIGGVLTAFAVAMVATLIKVPIQENPLTKMLHDPSAVIPLTIFGVTIAPLFEELFFRGFLQPLFARTLGVAGGIVAANIPFALLHYWEYGKSWRHVVVIALAGIAFGCMRYFTGSTRASTLMHASYNGLFFYALFSTKAHR